MKRTLWHMLVISALLAFVLATSTSAQSAQPQLTLKLRREFGYGGFGGEIQGNFRVSISGPQDLTRVVLQLDGAFMGEMTQAPFQWLFHTDNFAPGPHVLTAVGYTQTGQEIHSNEIRSIFLTSEQAGRAIAGLIVPLVGGILGFTLLAALVSYLVSRRTAQVLVPGAPRHYGIEGGTICPKCDRPFARHVWAPNLLLGKLERCPYCGHWSIARRASPQELTAAEAAEIPSTAGVQAGAANHEDALRRDLEESRFQDS